MKDFHTTYIVRATSALGPKRAEVDSFFEARRIARRRARAGEECVIAQHSWHGPERAIWKFSADGAETRVDVP